MKEKKVKRSNAVQIKQTSPHPSLERRGEKRSRIVPLLRKEAAPTRHFLLARSGLGEVSLGHLIDACKNNIPTTARAEPVEARQVTDDLGSPFDRLRVSGL